MARDERETGDRALLNLGHTFGHAFEAAAGFSDRLLHGEAVALGMVLAFEFSARRGLLPPADAERVDAHLAAVGLPTHVSDDRRRQLPDVDRLMDLIAQDKKVKRGQLTFILARGIGQAFVAPDVDAAAGARLPGREARRAMSAYDWFAIAVVLVCLLLSAFFAGSETALTASSRAHHACGWRSRATGAPRIVNRLLDDARAADRRAAARQQRRSTSSASSLATGGADRLVRRRRACSTPPSS